MIVSVGTNNAAPENDVGCTGDPADLEANIAWLLTVTPACVQERIDSYAARYDNIFSTITELRGGEPTVFVALNVYNANAGIPEYQAATPVGRVDEFESVLTGAYDGWNEMLCDHTTQHGFACVDTYHAFNGPDRDRFPAS